ncbi:PAS domain S-box-containing protein [Alteribacillus iranensis]|uniref:PAS domain S-box-containing protein n=1 Tax=Alteribacillus iranensis TaxID=930128 RepID=A0A1I2BI70_9BACI|nr:PAS domain S-box-containing protein [Alteribacillus iranensis]
MFDVQEEVNLVAEAIKSVLNIEVIIYDRNKRVVTSTGGGEHARVGETVRGHIIGEVFRTEEPVFNFNPGFHSICQSCELVGNCPEKADVSFPLYHEGEIVGAISLTAFSNDQMTEFRQKYSAFSNYLEKMADLISHKITSSTILKKYISTSRMLEVSIQSMYEGILALDQNGYISELNRSGEKMLQLKREEALGVNIEDVLPELPIQKVLSTGTGYNDHPLTSVIDGTEIQLVGSATPLIHDSHIIGVVVSFKDLNEVRNLVYSITSEDDNKSSFDMIIGDSDSIIRTKQTAKKVAQTDSTVIILGESGTGKELFARSIHHESPRADKPFRAINCAAIPEHLLESELFGYSEGAFTGANKKGKPGKFEMANEGTLFLDEIGDMPLHLQVKILRVLEEKRVERVGSNEVVDINVRIVAATNKNLEKMVETGEFREDLYYRLNVIPLHIPPLKERVSDIPKLLNHFAVHYSELLEKPIRGFTKEAEGILKDYTWPGNIRELQNAVEYAVNMAIGPWVKTEYLPPRIKDKNGETSQPTDAIMTLEEMEEKLIEQALSEYGETVEGKRKAAEALGINLATLYRKINKLKKLREMQN